MDAPARVISFSNGDQQSAALRGKRRRSPTDTFVYWSDGAEGHGALVSYSRGVALLEAWRAKGGPAGMPTPPWMGDELTEIAFTARNGGFVLRKYPTVRQARDDLMMFRDDLADEPAAEGATARRAL